VNLSVWRGDCCTETFQLERDDAARLIAHLADGLAAVGRATASESTTWERTVGSVRRLVARVVAH
jgi:hypothetical protein